MRTPAPPYRSATVSVPSWLSHTAWLAPIPVSGTVASPARALTVTVAAAVVAAPAVVAAGTAAASTAITGHAAQRRRRAVMKVHPLVQHERMAESALRAERTIARPASQRKSRG